MIVNPLLFCAMNVCSCLKVFSSIMTIVTGVIFCGLGCFCVVAMNDEYEFNKIIETGVSMTLNTGECPSVARESTLSQILEANAPEKYSLSAKACAGILRRAERRGKELPAMLREALEESVSMTAVETATDVPCRI